MTTAVEFWSDSRCLEKPLSFAALVPTSGKTILIKPVPVQKASARLYKLVEIAKASGKKPCSHMSVAASVEVYDASLPWR